MGHSNTAADLGGKPTVAPTSRAPLLIKDVGFATPECVLYDAESDLYLVSNINGTPTDKDDNGFISRVAPDGSVKELKWIDAQDVEVNLNAPKGMAISGSLLYIADIDFVRIFDRKTGEPKGKIGVQQATFLNGLAAGPDGAVYVTDSGLKLGANGLEGTGTDAIYKISSRGNAETLIAGAQLNRPNGIAVSESGVWVVTYGAKELYRVSNKEREGVVELPAGALDGLVLLNDGSVLVSSWETSSVYRGKDGVFTVVAGNAKSPAAIGYDGKRDAVLIPLFTENAVMVQALDSSDRAPRETVQEPNSKSGVRGREQPSTVAVKQPAPK